tara:strand:- start:189 stop:626 length:438 start_codon:yes stop_codon:yes gene_type:complete
MLDLKTRFFDDGRIEIKRVFDRNNLGHWDHRNPLAYEQSIMWMKNIDTFPFIRSTMVGNAKSRRGPLLSSGSRQLVLGYARLTADAPRKGHLGQYYLRRVFYLTAHDLTNPNAVRPDSSCLDTASIIPTVHGDVYRPSDITSIAS